MSFLRSRRHRGLTLVEIVVVLTILAALSGIAVATLPGFLKKTHGSTSASSIQSGEQAIAARLFTSGTVGNNFDLLNDNTAAGATPDYIGNFTAVDVTSVTGLQSALASLGITQGFPAAFTGRATGATPLIDTVSGDPNGHATFDGHDYTAPAAAIAFVSEATSLVSTDAIEAAYNIDPADFDNYYVFGLGSECTLVGLEGSFKECPLHTPGEGTAALTYSRYAIVIGFDATEEVASYVGIMCIDDGENLKGIEGNLREFYE